MNKFTTELMFYLLSGSRDLYIIPNDMLLWIVLMEVKTNVFLNKAWFSFCFPCLYLFILRIMVLKLS